MPKGTHMLKLLDLPIKSQQPCRPRPSLQSHKPITPQPCQPITSRQPCQPVPSQHPHNPQLRLHLHLVALGCLPAAGRARNRPSSPPARLSSPTADGAGGWGSLVGGGGGSAGGPRPTVPGQGGAPGEWGPRRAARSGHPSPWGLHGEGAASVPCGEPADFL